MIDICLPSVGIEISKFVFAIISFSIAGMLLFSLKKFRFSTKSKITLIYAHIISLFFPLVLLTTSAGCGLICASCYTNISHLLILAVPSTLIVSSIAGFIAIPAVFVYSNRRNELSSGRVYYFIKKSSEELRIKQPKIYTINKSQPIAFSFRNFKSAVFLSVGLFDILKWKEVQSVILHELAHIKQRSSALKLSTFFLRVFSPVSILLRFHHNNEEEERRADRLAIKIQGTDKHLKSARKKIEEYEKYGN